MALKVAEVYVEIFPKINSAARKAAVASIAQDFDKAFGDAFNKADQENAQSTNRQVNDRRRGNNDIRNDLSRTDSAAQRFFKHNDEGGKKNESTFHKMATGLRTIGTVMRGIAIPLALVGAINGIGEAIQGIVAAAPIAAAAILTIPAALAATVAEGLILKAAFKGVGKSISDGMDPTKVKQFNEDLKKLAPAAQTFVRAIVGGLKKLPNIQEVFFSQRSLEVARSNFFKFIEGIKGSLKQLVAANGNLFGRIFGTLTNARGTKEVSSFLHSMASLLRQITPGLTAVSAGFLRLISVVGGQGAAHGGGINGALLKFAHFLQSVDVKKVFDAAIAAAKGFGHILGNVISIIGGIGHALGGSQALGASFFKSLIGITTTIKNFVNSKVGQQFIQSLVKVLSVLSHLANVAIKNALKLIADVFIGLEPVLVGIEPSLVGILNAVGQLGPAITSLLVPAVSALAAGLKIVSPFLIDLLNNIAKHPTLFATLAAGILLMAGYLKIINAESAAGAKTGFLLLLTAAAILLPKLWAMGPAFKAIAIALGVAAAAWIAYTLAQSASGIGLILTALGLLSVAIFELATHWKQVWDFITKVFTAVFKFLTGGFHGFAILLLLLLGPIGIFYIALLELGKHWRQIWTGMLVVLGAVKHGILVAVNDISHWFTVSLPHAAAVFWSAMVRYWNAALGFIKFVEHQILAIVNAIGHWFTVSLPHAAAVFWSAIVRYWNAALGFLRFVEHQILVIVNAIGHWFTVSIPHAAGVLWQQIFRFWNLIRGYTNNLRIWIVGAWNGVLHFFSSTVYGGLRKLSSFALSIWRGMLNNLNKYFIHPVVSAFTWVVGQVASIWKRIQGAIATPVNWVKKNVYNGVLVPLWNHTVAVLPGVPKIKGLATGGTVGTNTTNLGGGSRAAFATGGLAELANYGIGRRPIGRVFGPGGPTEDLVPAMLSPGEYVIQASTVRKLGQGFFDNLNTVGKGGRGPFIYGDPGHVSTTDHNFSRGGLASDGVNYLKGGGKGIFGSLSSWLAGTAKVVGAAVAGGKAHGQSATTVLAWLRSIANKTPYVLGGTTARGIDCSGLVGSVWARLTGHNPNQRYFVTGGSENSFLLHHGFKKGVRVKDSLLVGQNGEHTVGVLDGHRFEAAHSGTRVRYDDGATNALGMSQKYWMPATGGGGLLGGALGFIEKLAGKGLQFMMTPLVAMLKKIPGVRGILGTFAGDKAGSTDPKKGLVAGLGTLLGNSLTKKADAAEAAAEAALAAAGGVGNPTDLNLKKGGIFASWVNQASRYVNLPSSWLTWLLYIMQHESGGNPHAVNRSDSNARAGHPSQGLMQLIPSTFSANVPSALRHLGIQNPVANLAAAVNYIHHRYGTIFNTPWAKHTGTFYNKGGLVGAPQLFDQGGIWKSGTLGLNMSGHDEAVFSSPKQLASSGYGGPQSIEVNAYFGTEKIEKIMDSRIAKHDDAMINYVVTRHNNH